MKYDCPNCTALEGERHYDQCILAGLPVWPGYNPPDYEQGKIWLRRNKPVLEREYAGRYVLVNAVDLTAVAAENHDKACILYKERHGKTPPGGRHFLGKHWPLPR
jgi:hypothetical protein